MGKAVRRYVGFLVILRAFLVVLAWPQPAAAWRFDPGPWTVMLWSPVLVAHFPAPLPYGSRFYYPPGVPFSYDEPASGTTYCLSRPIGVYYVCGYSVTTREPAQPPSWMPVPVAPWLAEQGLPVPSGVLIFRLPQDAEATVDGDPVGLSGGFGVTSVTPGRHQVVVRVSGAESGPTVAVSPHSIFTVTPTAIMPTAP